MKSSKTIKRIRLEMCKTRLEFAKLIKVSTQSIGNYERGVRQPNLSVIKTILELAKKNKIDIKSSDFFD